VVRALSPVEESNARRTLARLVQLYPIERGNWEVDCPQMVEKVLAVVRGVVPLPGCFAVVASDRAYTFIDMTATETEALEVLATWVSDDEFPKRPVVLADLLTGSIHSVQVRLSKGGLLSTNGRR